MSVFVEVNLLSCSKAVYLFSIPPDVDIMTVRGFGYFVRVRLRDPPL